MIYEVNYAVLYFALRDRVRELGYPIDEDWESQVLTVSRTTPIPSPFPSPALPGKRGDN